MPELPDLDAPLRAMILADSAVTSQLSSYKGSRPVFTRTPVPTDTPFPYIVIADNTNLTHEDGVDDQRIVVVREVGVFSSAEPPPDEWRLVESIGRALVNTFHKKPKDLSVPGWNVVNILVNTRGFPPNDVLAQSVGFIVVLTITLAARND